MWNNELIASITLGATATVPIVVAMTQMVKVTGWVSGEVYAFCGDPDGDTNCIFICTR